MSFSAFKDPNSPPSMGEMLAILGAARPLWEELAGFMADSYGIEGEIHSYGKASGWMVWFRRSGKTLLALYPREGGVTAGVVIGPSQEETAMALPLGERARRALEGAKMFPEGRWFLLELESEQDAWDVEQLVLTKSRPPRRHAPEAADS